MMTIEQIKAQTAEAKLHAAALDLADALTSMLFVYGDKGPASNQARKALRKAGMLPNILQAGA
jgi:IS5 family transposase